MIIINDSMASSKLRNAFKEGRIQLIIDCDEVITPEESGNHKRVKGLVTAAGQSGLYEKLFGGQDIKIQKNEHGHIVNFPILLFEAFRRGPEVLSEFVAISYGSGKDFDAPHYQVLQPDIDTLRFMAAAEENGNYLGIYSSGPYSGHMEGVLQLTGLYRFFSYPQNIFDVVKACQSVPQDLVNNRGQNIEKAVAAYFKPSDSAYAHAIKSLWGDDLPSDRIIVCVDDGVHNLQPALRRGDLAIWVNPKPAERVVQSGQLMPQIQVGALSEMAELLDIRHPNPVCQKTPGTKPSGV